MFNMFVSKSLDIHSILSNLFQPCSMLTMRNLVLISNTTLDVTVRTGVKAWVCCDGPTGISGICTLNEYIHCIKDANENAPLQKLQALFQLEVPWIYHTILAVTFKKISLWLSIAVSHFASNP